MALVEDNVNYDEESKYVKDGNDYDGFDTCALGLALVKDNVNDDEVSEDENYDWV